MLSTATATLSVGAASNIQATGTVALTAKAVSNATTSNNAQLVGVDFGSSQPTATVNLANGASVVSDGDFAMTAVANNTLNVTDLVDSSGSVNVSLAYGYARTMSSATVQNGASIQMPDVAVNSVNTNSFSTQAIAAGYNQSGSAGVGAAVAVGDYQSTATATVSGQVTTPGTATINAQSTNSQNLTRSFGAVSSPTTSSNLLTAIQNYIAGTTLPTTFNGNPISFTGTGPLSVAVGGAVTVVVSDNTASASLGSGGQVTAGTMTVGSTATDNIRLSAASSAGDSSKDSVGGAVAVSSYSNVADAFLGNSAIANVTGILTVTATANVPNQVTAFTPANPTFPTDSATGSARVGEQSSDGGKIGMSVVNALTPVEAYLNGILDDPTQIGTSFVDASGTVNQGDGVGVGGSVNILNIGNTANAYIGQLAKVNQNATGTTQDVIVTANGTLQTVDPEGLASALNFTNGGAVANTAVGGSLQVINNTNNVHAYIDAGALVSAGRDVKVTATSNEYLFADTQGGSAAGSVGVDGAMSYVTLTNNTVAYIQDEATVQATHDVDVTATNNALDINLQGGLAQGAVVGVGVSAGLTVIDGTTQAVLGNVNNANGTPGSVQAGDNVNLTATSTENIWTVSVSGANSPGIRTGSGGTQQFTSQNYGYGLAGNEEYGYGVSGDVAFNLVTDNTSALINSGVTVTAANDVYLTASDTPTLIAGAGAVAFGNDIGIGGSFAANDLSQTTQALTQNAIIKNTANVNLYATANVAFVTLSNGASGAKTSASVAGSVNLEILNGVVTAALGDGTTTNVTGSILIEATNTLTVMSDAGATSQIDSNSPAVGAALDFGTYNETVEAYLGNGTTDASGNISVFSSSAEKIDSISASLVQAAQSGTGVDGSGSVTILSPVVMAFISGTASTPQSIYLNAADTTNLISLAGAGANGGTGVGLSGAVCDITDREVYAKVGANAVVNAGGNGSGILDPGGSNFGGAGLSLHAATFDTILSYSQGIADAGDVAVIVSGIFNNMSSDTEAFIDQGAKVNTQNAGAAAGQLVQALATHTTNILSLAGAYAGAKTVGVGAAGDVENISRIVKAYVGQGATVDALGNVLFDATAALGINSTAEGGAGLANVSIAASASVLLPSTTVNADITGAQVTTGASVGLYANGVTTLNTNDGAAVTGGTFGFGISNSTVKTNDDTEAFVGPDSTVTAPGGGSGLTVFTGNDSTNGTPLTTVLNGLSIQAIAAETITPVVVSSNGAGGAGLAGSAVLNLLTEQTEAHIDDGATVNASTAGANPNQTVNLLAWDVTAISSRSGGTSTSTIGGIGGGADIGVINKQTEAFIANSASTPATPAHVSAVGNVVLQALNQEAVLSISGTAAAGLAAAIAGAASVYTVNDTTEAYVGAGTTVEAGGNVQIAANDSTAMNLTAGPSSANLSLGVSIGAAAGVAILNKTTSAFIGSGATVDANANAPAITVDTGTFNVTNVAPSGQDGQVTAPPVTNNTLISLLADVDLTKIRIATPATETMQGVAVTATNEDNIASAAASFGAALVAPIQVAGAVSTVNNMTSAYIGSSAKVNQNTPSAGAAQTVLVTAGDDYHLLGVGGAATGGLLTAIGTGGALVLGKNQTTEAYIGTMAQVSAAQDVIVTAGASEDILLVAAEASGSLIANIAGAVATVSLNDKTYAYVDANAVVNAGGSVLIYAHDDTSSEIISGAATLGLAGGVGAGLAVTDLSKDTAAYIGTDATVNASGNAGNGFAGFSGVVNASSFATATVRGVVVQAESSENVHTFSASGAAGYAAQVAGAVSVDIFEADTEAYIAAGAQVNQGQNAANVNAGQTVDVAAADYLNVTSLGGSIVSGLASLAGAADLGFVRNSTTAWLGMGAAVNALQDVDVYALTNWNVSSSAISAGRRHHRHRRVGCHLCRGRHAGQRRQELPGGHQQLRRLTGFRQCQQFRGQRGDHHSRWHRQPAQQSLRRTWIDPVRRRGARR